MTKVPIVANDHQHLFALNNVYWRIKRLSIDYTNSMYDIPERQFLQTRRTARLEEPGWAGLLVEWSTLKTHPCRTMSSEKRFKKIKYTPRLLAKMSFEGNFRSHTAERRCDMFLWCQVPSMLLILSNRCCWCSCSIHRTYEASPCAAKILNICFCSTERPGYPTVPRTRYHIYIPNALGGNIRSVHPSIWISSVPYIDRHPERWYMISLR